MTFPFLWLFFLCESPVSLRVVRFSPDAFACVNIRRLSGGGDIPDSRSAGRTGARFPLRPAALRVRQYKVTAALCQLLTQRKKVDVCYIDETPFVYVACLGDYIDMAYNTPRDLKKKYGKTAYILYGLRQLRNKIHRYKVKYKVDGIEHEGEYSFFFITNSSRVAGVDDIYYDVKMDDNMFEVALANPKTKADILRMLVQVTLKDVKEVPGITYYQTNNFEIEFLNKRKTSWCIDGEEYPSSSNKFTFKVEQKIKMLIPRTNVKKLFDK